MAKTHQERMAHKKAVVDQKIAKATEERGVLILLKGNGKGKSSSALGTMARAVGHGQKAAVIQFIKGRKETGEFKFFRDHPSIEWHVMGHGFTWETQDKEQEVAKKRESFEGPIKKPKDHERLAVLTKYGYSPREVLKMERVKQTDRNARFFSSTAA